MEDLKKDKDKITETPTLCHPHNLLTKTTDLNLADSLVLSRIKTMDKDHKRTFYKNHKNTDINSSNTEDNTLQLTNN
jgi:hypothetical protein